ncbi:MAG: hypothetical protein V7K32_24995 [Nostoc sp.]
MRDELAGETIDNSFQIERNHPMIQQHQNWNSRRVSLVRYR